MLAKRRLENRIWAKFGLGNGIYTSSPKLLDNLTLYKQWENKERKDQQENTVPSRPGNEKTKQLRLQSLSNKLSCLEICASSVANHKLRECLQSPFSNLIFGNLVLPGKTPYPAQLVDYCFHSHFDKLNVFILCGEINYLSRVISFCVV